MRVLIAFAVAMFGTVAITPARAADLSVPPSVGTQWFVGQRAEPVVIFDDEPGVVVRPYWLPPWRNRHYFPMTGRGPRLGRRENLSARTAYRPAQSFYREWTTRAFMAEPFPAVCARSIGHPYCPAQNLN
jgi:hypothetical protein